MTKQELGELIIESQEQLYRVAKTILYRDADCEEAISEAIVKSFARLETLRAEQYARTWLIRILINECYTILRQQKRTTPAERLPEQETEPDSERYSDLYEAIHRLPEEMRLAVTLYYLEGYRVKEVAELMRMTENMVKKRLMHARMRLRRELEEDEEPPGVIVKQHSVSGAGVTVRS